MKKVYIILYVSILIALSSLLSNEVSAATFCNGSYYVNTSFNINEGFDTDNTPPPPLNCTTAACNWNDGTNFFDGNGSLGGTGAGIVNIPIQPITGIVTFSSFVNVTDCTLWFIYYLYDNLRTTCHDDAFQVFDGVGWTQIFTPSLNQYYHFVIVVDFGTGNNVSSYILNATNNNILGSDLDRSIASFGNALWQVSFDVNEGQMDLLRIYNGTDCPISAPPPPPVPGAPAPTVNILSPSNISINNTLQNTFTYNVTFPESTPDNCSLFLNSTGTWQRNLTNQTAITNNTNNTFLYINLTSGHYLWNVMCGDNNSNSSFATNNFTYIIDITDPTLIDNFVNNTVIFFRNLLTGQFNFTDNERINSVNFTIPTNSNQIIFNETGINTSTYQYNLSFNISALPVGNHTLRIRYADIHTANELRDEEAYNPQRGGLFDSRYLRYRFKEPYKPLDLKISLKDGSIFDKWDYEIKKDRYEESVKPQNPSSTQTIIVESTEKIERITATERDDYGGDWLIVDEHWKDFKLKDEPLARVSKIEFINDYYVEVTIVNITNNINYLRFESTGDLNVVTITYSFFIENVTEIFSTPILNNVATEMFLDFNGSGHSAPSIVILEWNHTNYTTTQTINNATLARYRQIITPTLDLNTTNKEVNISHKWYFNLTGEETTATQNQSIQQVSLDNCSDLTTVALNYTIKDEGNQSLIYTGDVTGTYNYNIGSGTGRTFNLVVVNQSNFTICIFPAWITFGGNYTLTYNAEDYQQRGFIDNNPSITNITQDIDLFLLADADGIFGIFRTIDTFQANLENVLITMIKVIGASPQTVEIESTDDSGLATFFVNPDVTYTFTFAKAGFATQTFNLRITTSEIITVTMGSTAEESVLPLGTGITYEFTPSNEVPNNGTDTNFTIRVTSSFRNIINCTFFLFNGTALILNTTGVFNGTNCTADILLNTGNYTNITSEVRYTLNDTTLNQSFFIALQTPYRVRVVYVGDFSLRNFFDDVNAFVEGGFNATTRMIIALIIIVAIVSVATMKLPVVRDPERLVLLVWGLVFLFSYIGWFTVNVDTLPTIRGFSLQKWIIFIITSLTSASYILRREIT